MMRLTADKDVARAVEEMATREQRSFANMVSVLVTEALLARRERGHGEQR